MNYFTTTLLRSLISNDNNLPAFEQVVSELFRSELENAINDILKSELTVFLDYEKYDRSENSNSRNGYYNRDYNTKYGVLNLRIPRDRQGDFDSPLVPKYQRNDLATTNTVIDLFNSGMTNSDIVKTVESIYGRKYSRQTVSNITKEIVAHVEAFKNRPLNKQYAVVYTDATVIPLRRDTVSKEAVHIAIGVTLEGTKEILGYSIAPTESATTWRELFEEFKKRGMEEVALFCTDGLTGVENAIEDTFPMAKIQRCLVHVSRNIVAKARVKERSEIAQDFKRVYNCETEKAASEALKEFTSKWGKKYPKVAKSLEENSNLFTFYLFPESVRKSIYTTNLIEGFNKQLKRKIKAKEQFPNEEAAEKYIVSQFEQYNQKFMNHTHKGFKGISYERWFLLGDK
ncbi:MAG: IS256 family transposase [Erysipelotrichaceae bacterium]|nr:IS256 family transposase [Erysipelotrichaceae bacterium]